MDPYSVLGVSEGADKPTIKRSYRKLAQELHPDLNPNTDSRRFLVLQSAYEHLIHGKPFRYAMEQTAPSMSRRSPGYQPWNDPYDPFEAGRAEAIRTRNGKLARNERDRRSDLAAWNRYEEKVHADYFASLQAIFEEYAERMAYVDKLIVHLASQYDTSQPYTKVVFDSRVHTADEARQVLTAKRNSTILDTENFRNDEIAKVENARIAVNAAFDREALRIHQEYDDAMK